MMKFPLPKVNPNIIIGFSIITTIIFLISLRIFYMLAFAMIVITLLLDWLDGLVARKYNMQTEGSYLADITADRISEGSMFIPFFFPWFLLFALNNVLTMFSFIKKKHIILPLRQIFMIYFFFRFII